jgi:hypothetical protein
MSGDDLRDFRDEGCDPFRNTNLHNSASAMRAWEREHPWSLDDFMDFLRSFREIFGDPPARGPGLTGTDFRL